MSRKIAKGIGLALAMVIAGVSVAYVTVFAAEPAEGTEDIVYTERVVADLDMDYSCEDTAYGVEVVTQDEKSVSELTEGDILLLPAETDSEVMRAVEVTAITDTRDGYRIETKEPEDFADVVEYLDVSGKAGADISGIVTADGVSVQTGITSRAIGTSGTLNVAPLQFQIDRSFGEYGSVHGNILMIPALEYRLLFDFGGIQELELRQCGQLEIRNLGISGEVADVIPVATIPYTFADGMFTAYVTLQIVYTASGEAYLDYVMDGTVDVLYNGSEFSFLCDYNPQELSYGIGGYGDVGANLGMGLVAYGTYTLMDVEVNAGIRAEGQMNSQEGQADFGVAYFYMDGSFGQNSVLSQYGVYGSKVFFGKDNSPLKYEVIF